MHAWRGEPAAARAALAELAGEEHDRAGVRIAEAAGPPRRGRAGAGRRRARRRSIECREPAIKATWAAIDASLLDALAREQLGDRRAAEASIERALDLAEPEGVLLPFVLFPVRELLERHPRHRTAHATLLSEILDVLAGLAAAARGAAAPLHEELSEAELRVVRYLPSNLKAPEIARGAVRLVEHGADAPAPHLRQARRAQPLRGGGPRPRARPAGPGLTRALTAPRRESHTARDDRSPTRAPYWVPCRATNEPTRFAFRRKRRRSA